MKLHYDPSDERDHAVRVALNCWIAKTQGQSVLTRQIREVTCKLCGWAMKREAQDRLGRANSNLR